MGRKKASSPRCSSSSNKDNKDNDDNVSSLPSEEEAIKSVSLFLCPAEKDDDDEIAKEWKSIILETLSYGTDYDIPHSSSSSSSSSSSTRQDVDPLSVRQPKALKLLSAALSHYEKHQENKEEEESVVTPHSVLVDTLWLVGTLLEPTANPIIAKYKLSSSSSSSSPASHKPSCYEKFCNLINSLAASHSSLIPHMQKTLEPQLLASSGLLHGNNSTSMLKKLKKINTDLFYRQTKFNLCQEESEGYAKLLVFLSSLQSSSSEEQKHHVVKVRELIGTFDLDPNRVLDLTLDVLEVELDNFLNCKNKKKDTSSSLKTQMKNAPLHATTVKMLLQILQQFHSEAIPHLLGVKYISYYYYSSSFEQETPPFAPKQKNVTTPPSLYLLTALLSLHDLLDVSKLLPHLQPSLEILPQCYKKQQKEYTLKIKKMGTISLNKKTVNKEEEQQQQQEDAQQEKEDELMFDNNQIVTLISTLLQLEAWEDVTDLLSTAAAESIEQKSITKEYLLEVICGVYPDVASHVCSYVESVIEPLYKHKISDTQNEVWTDLCSATTTTKTLQEKTEENELFSLLPKSSSYELTLDSTLEEMVKSSSSIMLSSDSTLEEMVEMIVEPIKAITHSGAIRYNPLLYCKLCRLFAAFFKDELHLSNDDNDDDDDDEQDDAEEEEEEIDLDETTYTILHTFLVPSLSLYPSNPAITSELWSVLSLLPYLLRYKLYKSWSYPSLEKGSLRSLHLSPNTKPLPIIESEVQTGLLARATLKRLSKDNVKDMGRRLSKLTHNNPLVVFTKILNQIESYDNLIVMMVETFKFVSCMGLDVIGYCLFCSLGGEEEREDGGSSGRSSGAGSRSKLKMDGVNVTQWLSSLETFTGAFYKKFPSVELRGILQYLTHRLRNGYILELGVLRSLLKTAGGYSFADTSSTASLSQIQLEGRCGSQLLKKETSSFGIVEKTNKKASKKLRSVLQKDNLGVIILILLSQIRYRVMYHVTKHSPKHIKLIGNLYDNCVVVMGLMLEFLTDLSDDSPIPKDGGVSMVGSTAIAKYASSLPTLGELHNEYGVETAVSWMLARPPVRVAMLTKEENSEKEDDDEKKSSMPSYLQRFQPDCTEMQNAYSSMLPKEAWKAISPSLFEMFYSHSLGDLHCPEERYTIEIARLKREVDRLTQVQQGSGEAAAAARATMAAAAAAAGGSRMDVQQAVVFTKSQEQELDRVKRTADILTSDRNKQKQHCEAVKRRFESRKNDLLSTLDKDDVAKLTTSTFLTYCVYPRSLLSPEDAMYCAHFVKLLHEMETPHFQTMSYLDGLIDAVVGAFYCITEDEAGNIGVLLGEMWKLVSKWRYDGKVFEKEVTGKPGSYITKENDAPKKDDDDNESSGDTKVKSEAVSFAGFTTLYNRWHATIGEAAMGCLKSSEYMHTRAALIVLNRIVRVYPTRPALGEKIFTVLEPLQGEENPRPDLRAMAQAYGSQLTKARDDGVWTEQDDAVAKARIAKEKMELEERRKKAEEQLEEMKRESDQITHHIGDGRTRNARFQPRDPRVGHYPDRGPPRASLNPSAATFTPPNGGATRDLHPHSSAYPSRGGASERRDHTRDWSQRGDRDSREHQRDHHAVHSDARSHKWERDRGQGGVSTGSSGVRGAPQQQQAMDGRGTDRDTRSSGSLDTRHQHGSRGESSSLRGRWEREREDGSNKRSRSPMRDEGPGGSERSEMKRIRTQPPSVHDRGDRPVHGSSASLPPSRGGGDPRRGDGRDGRDRGGWSQSSHMDRGGGRRIDRRSGPRK